MTSALIKRKMRNYLPISEKPLTDIIDILMQSVNKVLYKHIKLEKEELMWMIAIIPPAKLSIKRIKDALKASSKTTQSYSLMFCC